jgi:asparagine synthase (glutamine-hydrolysing)
VALAARDPFAIKPLYLARRGNLTALASTMRPLARLVPTGVDEQALGELLTFAWASGGLSNLKGIERVPGGTLLRVPLAGGEPSRRRFADILDGIGPGRPMGQAEAEATVRAALDASVRDHLASDVGYALQLSGGVDSSMVAVLAVRAAGRAPASFGIAIPGFVHDEARWRVPVVAKLGLDHTELPVDGRVFADALPRAVAHMEGPLPHLACALLMLLCDRVRERTKVVLTGEGADEMFGGYLRYGQWRKLLWQERIGKVLPESLTPRRLRFEGVRRFAGLDAAAYAGCYVDWLRMKEVFPGLVPQAGARDTASRRFRDFRDRLLAVDRTAQLESLLVRQDKMAMAASVEARVPFLHLPLYRAINAVPRSIRIPGGRTKPLLKRIAEPDLPHDLIHRRKVGLRLPAPRWLAEPEGLGRYLDDLAAPDGRVAAHARSGAVAAMVEAFRRGERGPLGDILVRLVNVETWLRSLDAMPAP